MIKIICFFLLMYCVENTMAQYTVTKVKGTVTNKSSGELLKTGSKLKETDLLSFSTASDLIRVIVAGKGVFVISPSPKATRQGNIVIEMLKSTFHLQSKEGYLSGRAEEVEYLPESMETDNTVNTKLIISKENKYLFRLADYSTGDGSRFFLQVTYPGQQPETRALKTNKDTLLLRQEDFKKNNQPDPENAKYVLGFYSKENNSSSSLIEFEPTLDAANEIANIIKVILEASNEKDPGILKKQCYKEVYEALGKPNELVFNQAFREQMTEKDKKKSK